MSRKPDLPFFNTTTAGALSDTTLHAQGEERPLTPVWVLKQLGGWGCVGALSDVPARLGLEALATARLGGLTACHRGKPGPEPSKP